MSTDHPDEKPVPGSESLLARLPRSTSEPVENNRISDGNAGSELTVQLAAVESSAIEAGEPGWLHWSSLVFDVISHSRNYLVPVIIALFSVAKGDQRGIYIAGLFFFPSLVFSLFRYFTLRYRIQDRQFVVSQGLIFRNVRTVPVDRIQNVDLVQNVLHRIFSVAEVRIETASGSEPEAVLRVLSMSQVEQLREEIFGVGSSESNESNESQLLLMQSDLQSQNGNPDDSTAQIALNTSDMPAFPTAVAASPDRRTGNASAETILEIPLSWLIRAGLASNRGMIMVGIALGLAYQSELLDFRVNVKNLWNLLPAGLSQTMMVVLALLGLVGVWLVLRILGIGWYVLRFSNYRLVRKGEDLQISCGLLTKVSATVPRQRIQLVSIHRNLLMRWMKLASIRIETAGSSSERDDATKSVSRQWFLPVVPRSEVPRILRVLRTRLDWRPDELDWVPLSDRAFARRMRPIILISMVLIGVGIYFSRVWGWLPGTALFFLWTILNRLDVRFSRYSRFGGGVVHESGWFNRKTTLTFFERIQVIKFDQSPFDRRWKMASLTVDTAGAGAAEHSVSLAMLDADFAKAEHRELRRLAACHQPDFSWHELS